MILPKEIHISHNWIGTLVEDESIEWSELAMEPHFQKLFSFNLKHKINKYINYSTNRLACYSYASDLNGSNVVISYDW